MTESALTANVIGVEQLGRTLLSFGDIIAQKYLRRATYAPAALFAAEAQRRAPRFTGAMAANVAVFKRPNPSPTSVEYAVGERGIRITKKVKRILRVLRKESGKFQRINGATWYWVLIEFGYVHVGGRTMAPKPFYTTAFESKKQDGIEVFRTVLADGVVAAAEEASR